MARMARERSVKLAFGPKKGQWRIEADLSKEAMIYQRIADGQSRAQTILTKTNSQQGQSARHAASMRALSILQSAESSTASVESGNQQRENSGTQASAARAPEMLLDPARLLLPTSGIGREALQHELSKLKPIDDSSLSDQVVRKILLLSL